MSSIAEAVSVAAPSFAGQLLRPTDPAYDDRRRVHNGLIDKRPALIASCQGVADIVEALDLARSLGLDVSVRGGGHNVAGRAAIDGGLMIDLSPMKGIHVDVRARTVHAQGGVVWKELNRETQLSGLATTGGVVGSTAGVRFVPTFVAEGGSPVGAPPSIRTRPISGGWWRRTRSESHHLRLSHLRRPAHIRLARQHPRFRRRAGRVRSR